MCGRYGLFEDIENVASQFGLSLTDMPDYAPSWNIAPTASILAITAGPEARIIKWGISGNQRGRPLFNARAETVHRLPTFRDAYNYRRCLVPANGFYEWQKSPTNGDKNPVWIRREDRRPFAFAGIISTAAAVITTAPNSLMAPIHHRMPVIIEPEHYELWLEGDSRDQELQELLLPREWPELNCQPVSNAVNRVRNDGAYLVEPHYSPSPPLL